MTTNSCKNMTYEKKYTLNTPFIGHPSIIFKKSLTKNLKSINKKCCKVENYFSLKNENPLALQANVVYLFEGSCGKSQSYIDKTKRHLETRVREINACTNMVHHFCSMCFNYNQINI